MKFISTLKRVRVRKREKTPKVSRPKETRGKSVNTSGKFDIKETGQVTYDEHVTEVGRYASIDEIDSISQLKETEEVADEKEEDKKSGVLLTFEHELTEFEFKLRYLNLKDVDGKEYGRFFPPIRSQLVVVDEAGRNFSVTRVGGNQISGDLFSFFKANQLQPGKIISFEYDRDERSKNGESVLHLKLKKG